MIDFTRDHARVFGVVNCSKNKEIVFYWKDAGGIITTTFCPIAILPVDAQLGEGEYGRKQGADNHGYPPI
jgi:hypothetical protein